MMIRLIRQFSTKSRCNDRWNSIVHSIRSPDNSVKFAVKDNILTKGQTTSGSKILADFDSPFDATVVKLLGDYQLIGKANLDEFGMGSSNTNSMFGPTYNPLFNDGDYIAGGSSGGSAAAVASGICDFALGTDTGGSVRLPASNCGVFGFKPSYGRLSRWGVIPYAQTLDTVGIIAKDPQLLKKVYSSVNKYDDKDPTSLSESSREDIDTVVAKREADRKGAFTFGIPKEFLVEELSTSAKEKLLQVAETLIEKGHKVIPVSIPSIQKLLLAYYTVATAEAASNLSRYDGIRYGVSDTEFTGAEAVIKGNRSTKFGDEVKRRIILGNYTISSESGDHYAKATEVRKNLVDEFNRVFYLPNCLLQENPELNTEGTCDFLLSPTTVNEPLKVEEFLKMESENFLESYINDILTTPASLAGLPAISIPIVNKESKAQGIQLIGQFGDDEAVLDMSIQLMKFCT